MYVLIAVPLALASFLLFRVTGARVRYWVGSAMFFLTPILTATGLVGVLTGLDNTAASPYFFGISFYSVCLASIFVRYRDAPTICIRSFLATVLNPLYLFTGPLPGVLATQWSFAALPGTIGRLLAAHRELFIGAFFVSILANSLTTLFYLKDSGYVLDILLFGVVFELYVYFNFCGYSMLARSVSRSVGLDLPMNFAQPFGASSVVEYWRRWHMSLSAVLRDMFFLPVKQRWGIYPAVVLVFAASALWHGVSANFLLWGAFHTCFWCIAYSLHKRGSHILNLLLLPVVIVIGRLIFAESDWGILCERLSKLIHISGWSVGSIFELPLGLRDSMNIALAFAIAAFEVFLGRADGGKDYEWLSKPAIQILIAIYICLMFPGFHGEPVYGNR
jgi:alginate O-acetyltransferase complex protein AlgI